MTPEEWMRDVPDGPAGATLEKCCPPGHCARCDGVRTALERRAARGWLAVWSFTEPVTKARRQADLAAFTEAGP